MALTRDGARRRHVAETLADLNQVARHVAAPPAGTGNLQRIHDAQRGLAAARYDRDGGGHGGGISDATGEAAVQAGDPSAKDLATLDELLSRIGRDAAQAARLLGAYGPTRPANDADRLALQRDNTKPEPCCEHCATVESTNGAGKHWSDVDPRRCRRGPTQMVDRSTGEPRLKAAMFLCAWCADWVEVHDALPPKQALEAHRDGRRVMVRDLTPRRSA